MLRRSPALRPDSRLPERALVLTMTTLILLTPPILSIFDVPVVVLGIPLLHVYCFTVWLGAIGLGGWLAMRMASAPADAPPGEPPDGR